MFKKLKQMGPGALIAAAFIGPGTVTLCTLAGVKFGYELLWAMTLSIIATIVLQEMAARVGILTQKGLAENIKDQIKSSTFKKLAVLLIVSSIIIGNAAYEAGNISGATIGMQAVIGINQGIFPVIIGLIAFLLLFFGNYKIIEKSLVFLVILMSFAFIITAVLTKPDIGAVLKGAFSPTFPENSMLTIIGLIGTTVVPYNLFLHASIVQEKWKNEHDLKYAKKDTLIAVILGGFVSMSVIISATAIQGSEVLNGADLAKGLTPLFGDFAKYFLGFGLFAAGITSAITAPLAAAYVANSCFGWQAGLKDKRFRATWILILGLGVLLSSLKFSPIEVIKFAQVANGLLLPVVAMFLWWIVNRTGLLGKYKNKPIQNVLTSIIILITLILGFKSILKVFELL